MAIFGKGGILGRPGVAQGLLAAGAALQGGPSRMPQPFSMAPAMTAFQGGLQAGQLQDQRQKMFAMQQAQAKRQKLIFEQKQNALARAATQRDAALRWLAGNRKGPRPISDAELATPYNLGKDEKRFIGGIEIAKGPESVSEVAAYQGLITGLSQAGGVDAFEAKFGFKPTKLEMGQLQAAIRSGTGETVQLALSNIHKRRFQVTAKLRDEFSKKTTPLTKIIKAANQAGRIIDDPKGADDPTNQLMTLYNFIIAMDPDSVVREGEIALARQIQSIQQSFTTGLERVKTGKILAGDLIKKMNERIRDLGQRASSKQQRVAKFYTKEGALYGIGVDSIITPVTELQGLGTQKRSDLEKKWRSE